MPLNILFSDHDNRWAAWQMPLERAFNNAKLDVALRREVGDAADIDYIIYSPDSPVQDFTPFTGLKAVLSTWAGVDTIVANPTLKVPLARMSDDGLVEGMVEYVVGNVLRHHLGTDAHRAASTWKGGVTPPLARERRVGILGFGALGQACGKALHGMNFAVTGWSRSPKSVEFATCRHGDAGLIETLSEADYLVLLLPSTPATENCLNAETLAACKPGVAIVNTGRGTAIDDDALLSALDTGQVSAATLDVFRTEPLPEDHPYWAHPSVTITPHIAAETRPLTAARLIAENINRVERGEQVLHRADPAQGY